MSRHGDVTRKWGDGEYVFRLGFREWQKIDERFGIGPYELLRRISQHTWRAAYLSETLRWALQAGGSVVNQQGSIDDIRISALVQEYVVERPLMPTALFVADVLTAILSGPEEDPIPKASAAEGALRSSQMESSPSPSSTDGVQVSAIQSKRSKTSRSGSSKQSRPDGSQQTAAKSTSKHRPPPSIET